MCKSATLHRLATLSMPAWGVVALTLIVLGGLIALHADGRDVKQTLLQEIARVERDFKDAASADQRAPAEARLRRAADAAQRDRTLLALHELSTVWRMQASHSFAARLKDRVRTLDDFQREWASTGEPPKRPASTGLPAAVAAIASSSEATGPATYRASLPYAEDTNLQSGLLYLGDSQAAAGFGRFCRSLKFPPPGEQPSLRSIASEMDRFERDVVALYDKADADTRRAFVVINVGMKIAREREGSGDHPAALLQYLLARYQLGLVVTKKGSDDAATRLAAFSQSLKGADHTIAQLFLEMADTSLESRDERGARVATAIVDFVLPEYVEIVKR